MAKRSKENQATTAAGTAGGLRLEYVDPRTLSSNPRNWRTHPAEQRAALAELLADPEVGWAGVLLFNERTGRLVDGHARKDLAIEKGLAAVPVVIGSWSEEAEAKILLTLDPVAGMATANADALELLMREVDLKSSAPLKGLADDLEAMLNRAQFEIEQNREVAEDEAPSLDDSPTRCKAGDLWVMGDHRLLCGDSTKAEDVQRLMDGARAKMMNTDPPYGVAYSDSARVAAEHASGRRRRERRWGDNDIDNDSLDGPKLQQFLESCIRVAVPHLVENAAFYLWHPMLTQGTFFAAAAAAAAADILIHRQIIWVKPGLLFGFGDYHWQHELCFYGWRRGHRPEFLGERNQTTIWEVAHDAPSGQRNHPTQKPVELFSRPIQNHTHSGDRVYEPFAGSGSQFIAAEQLGRRCYGMEISPRYCDVILARWEKLTGRKAESAGAVAKNGKGKSRRS